MNLTENDVIDAVSEFLAKSGYNVENKLTTNQHGIDITAIHQASQKRLLIEAKGSTSSKKETARFGKPFTNNQAGSHVSGAFYCVAKLQQRHAHEGAKVAIALPDDLIHRKLVGQVGVALCTLDIAVFFVDEKKHVALIQGKALCGMQDVRPS